jgi:pimeloyl-ACP methyl ester carboxylesterase
MATFVLVHGAWHGGWCWKKASPFLRFAGHTVLTPTLTGLGERTHLLNPAIDLSTHVQDIVGVLECEELRDVILVGHSYGGFVITAVADRVPERLAHLVYLDAFVPEPGQSLFDLVAQDSRAEFEAQAQQQGDGWRIPPPPVSRWGITDAGDVHWMTEHLRYQPLKTFTQPLGSNDTLPPAIPRTYLSCTAGQKPHYAATAQRVRAEKGWRYRELPTGHDAMVTMPQQLADLLLELVGETNTPA